MKELRQRFERLAIGLQKPVYNAALCLAGNPEDALELTHAAFSRAYRFYLQGSSSGALRVVLYQELIDGYIEWMGESPAPPVWSEYLVELEELGSCSRDSSRPGFFPQPDTIPVERALGLLPRELRLALLLSDVEGFSYNQIARMVHRSRIWVAGNVYMGRRMLRAAMKKQSRRRPPIER